MEEFDERDGCIGQVLHCKGQAHTISVANSKHLLLTSRTVCQLDSWSGFPSSCISSSDLLHISHIWGMCGRPLGIWGVHFPR